MNNAYSQVSHCMPQARYPPPATSRIVLLSEFLYKLRLHFSTPPRHFANDFIVPRVVAVGFICRGHTMEVLLWFIHSYTIIMILLINAGEQRSFDLHVSERDFVCDQGHVLIVLTSVINELRRTN